ncbi:MAG: endonuclease domain-containing protein [Bacteroidota bacterium]
MSQLYTNHFYNKSLRPFARENRNTPTKAENQLWYQLLNERKMLGYKFLRQRPVSKYIADFMCKELWLIIEVDGSVHDSEEAKKLDAMRQRELEDLGFIVLRFSNYEVFQELHLVSDALKEWIRGWEKEHGSHPPITPPAPLAGG